ncbi:MAG: hypothetical protein HYS22_09250, partial [Deltaproteobacteria bacterium]|nr:hypothetical protein [Deltaproteobacteria bacterium]
SLDVGYRVSTGEHPYEGLMDELMIMNNGSEAVESCNNYLTTCLTAGLSCDFSCIPQ